MSTEFHIKLRFSLTKKQVCDIIYLSFEQVFGGGFYGKN